ncbi:hypothetical protein [Brevibacterium otitidis]|uniref:Scaffolding protein n=3 Tax=Brevibacterium otitidis TaxID=53364 RepID=A0ABV5X1L8_9MICO|nr:hypothetical protein GCM10023233_22730 [Brevibacterium otitidis]
MTDTTTDTTDATEGKEPAGRAEHGTDRGRDQTGDEQPDLASEVEKWKAMARKHEAQSKANADKAKQFDKWQESQKTEQQKADDALAALQKERDSAITQAALAKAALDHGLSADDFELIGGGSPDEINAKAEKLAARLKASRVPSTSPDPRLGRESKPTGSGDWLRDQLQRK